MRMVLRQSRRSLGVAALVLGVSALATGAESRAASAAESETASEPRGIDVVQINGLIDPPNADLLDSTITSAESRGATMVVVQLDSGGALDVDVAKLNERISSSKVPIVVWIGPAGSSASSAAALLATSGSYLSMASNAKLGPCDAFSLDAADRAADTCIPTTRLGADEAIEDGLADSSDPTLRNLLTDLDGTTVDVPAGGTVTLHTKLIDPATGEPSVNQDVRFHKLGVGGQLLHTLDAPWVAYFLLVVGLGLIVFEYYAASVGAATFVGVLALIGAAVGFSHLPVNAFGLAFVLVGVGALTVDLQAGGVGFWTGLGTLALVTGSVILYDGSARLDLRWWTITLVVIGVLAFWIGGLPAMLRTRFSTPTVGREGMVGEMGVAEVDVAPEGVVRVRGALWRARVNRATPITAGEPIRVVAVDGVVLEVEPEHGGAEDYRERARRRRD